MKVRMLLVAAALLTIASFSFAQDFQVLIYDDVLPLLGSCDANGGNFGTPIPDGTPIKIMWDANHATLPGRDPADVQPPVGPVTNGVNFNTFYMNGDAMGLGTGLFYTGDAWLSLMNVPTNPYFYLQIEVPGAVLWSDDYGPVASGPSEWQAYVWHCAPVAQACDGATADWNWNYNGHAPSAVGLTQCVKFCPNDASVSFTITVSTSGGFADPTRIPVLSFAPGCAAGGTPAEFAPVAPAVVTPGTNNIVYAYTVNGLNVPADGSFMTVSFDRILSARVTNIAMLPEDGAVKISFTTLSETNVSKFQILRNGAPVAELAAEGGAVSHDYSYTDESVVNNTRYEYVLRTVNNDGSFTDEATESVTPSLEHAVITEYKLHQNYPNPFNPSTTIRFDLVNRNFVTLKIYNATGQEVATVVNRECKAGVNVVNYDATSLTSGLYFYTVKIGNEYSATKKMLLLK